MNASAGQAPLKIAPKTADGVEIPDQNKQIYDRNSKEGQIRIVNREEQPVDVAQAARAAQRPAENGTTPTTATPGASQAPSQGTPQGTLAESLGAVESLIEHPGRMTHASAAGSPPIGTSGSSNTRAREISCVVGWAGNSSPVFGGSTLGMGRLTLTGGVSEPGS